MAAVSLSFPVSTVISVYDQSQSVDGAVLTHKSFKCHTCPIKAQLLCLFCLHLKGFVCLWVYHVYEVGSRYYNVNLSTFGRKKYLHKFILNRQRCIVFFCGICSFTQIFLSICNLWECLYLGNQITSLHYKVNTFFHKYVFYMFLKV